MTPNSSLIRRMSKPVYVIMGVMMVAMITLSFVQLWVLYTTSEVAGFGSVQADQRGWPQGDRRGAFIMLNPEQKSNYPGTLIELLATSSPGVVDEEAGAHLLPEDIKAILIQSAVVSEASDYRVYRLLTPETENQAPKEMRLNRQPGGKVMIIEPKDSNWEPGAWIVDVPSEGMFGTGRIYFQFYIDEAK